MLLASSWPARPSASKITCSAKPIATPISSCCATTTKPWGEKGAMPGAGNSGITSAVMAAASTTRVRAGTKRAPNIGATIRQAPMRANGKNPCATYASSCPPVSSIAMRLTDQPGNAFDEIARVLDQRAQHPGAGQRQHRGHGQQLGDERERHLVDLRRRLEDADDEAHGQRREQQRRREHECHLECVAADGDDGFGGHGLPT